MYLIVPLGIATILALNAALVEEMAAAASSLNAQASDLVQAVAVFKDYREGF